MSVCPNCKLKVKKGSGNKRKIYKNIYIHKKCPLHIKK